MVIVTLSPRPQKDVSVLYFRLTRQSHRVRIRGDKMMWAPSDRIYTWLNKRKFYIFWQIICLENGLPPVDYQIHPFPISYINLGT